MGHLGDTVLLFKALPEGTKTVLDIGTGAGVPGLLLKILAPELEVVLTDAVRKKVSFLKSVIIKLGLEGVWAEHGRVGDRDFPAQRPTEGFDLIVSRAVGRIDMLLELALPLLSSSGVVVAMKGPEGARELKDVRDLIQKLGLEVEVTEERLPILGHRRNLIFFRAESPQYDEA